MKKLVDAILGIKEARAQARHWRQDVQVICEGRYLGIMTMEGQFIPAPLGSNIDIKG